MFRKLLTSASMASVLALTIPFALPDTAQAQNRYCSCSSTRHRARRRTSYKKARYVSPQYAYANGYATTRTGYVYKRPNIYQRHRRLFNTAIGAGAGALIGGLLGGRRGAGIGLLGGGLGSQVFTHYQKPKNYYRVRRY